jgi:homopolymeric O-antigen transport system ATP-binding protein
MSFKGKDNSRKCTMNTDLAIKVENISKCYRIGLKENMHDSLGASILHFLGNPLQNYRKYRSLYQFDDLRPDGDNPPDVLWALKDVSFEVKKGEVVGIIGVNGAGKSTLLKILSKITFPTGGSVTIRGRISSLLEVGTGFHPELTGRENVYLNGTILGMRKKEIERKFEEIVDFSGVEKFIDTPVKRYSSGMKVRLAFAVAAHLEPEILVIDEVLAVGDAQFQKKCMDKMKDVGQHGRTVLFVSHNMQAITRLCPRAILLNDGQVLAEGPSCEMVSFYLNSEGGAKPEKVWPDLFQAPGDDVIRLCALRARAVDGRVTGVVNISQAVSIELEYEVLQSGHEFEIYFKLINGEGIDVFQSIDNDPSWRKKSRPIGRYVSRAWIPGNLLAEGMYVINPRVRTRFWVDDALGIQVVDPMDGAGARVDTVRDIPGVVRPLLKWETEFFPR